MKCLAIFTFFLRSLGRENAYEQTANTNTIRMYDKVYIAKIIRLYRVKTGTWFERQGRLIQKE
jgi:hypothetical protein